MDDQARPAGIPADEPAAPGADETFTWTGDAGGAGAGGPGGETSGGSASASNVIDQLRATAEDLAEKAAPAVRELSAKAAELTAVAAVKAAPLVKRAGEVTAEASEKLAESARTWAEQIRGSGDDPGTTGGMASTEAGTGAGYGTPATAVDDAPTPSDLAADTGISADTSSAPAPFETTGEGGGDERAPDGPTI